jgi:hypothetical protein
LERHVGKDVVGEHGVRRAREENLTTMARSADASRTMDAESDVAIVRRGGLARMQAHPDADSCALWPLMACVCALSCKGSGDRVLAPGEDGEERVSLGVDLQAARSCKGTS